MKGKKQRKVIHNRKRRPTHPGELLREEILPVSVHIEGMREDGDAIPEPSSTVKEIEVFAK